MSLDPDEMVNLTEEEMAQLRNMFHWKPLTQAKRKRLDALEPDHALGRAAAIEYLDRPIPDPLPHRVSFFDNIILPISLAFILAGLLGLTTAFVR